MNLYRKLNPLLAFINLNQYLFYLFIFRYSWPKVLNLWNKIIISGHRIYYCITNQKHETVFYIPKVLFACLSLCCLFDCQRKSVFIRQCVSAHEEFIPAFCIYWITLGDWKASSISVNSKLIETKRILIISLRWNRAEITEMMYCWVYSAT